MPPLVPAVIRGEDGRYLPGSVSLVGPRPKKLDMMKRLLATADPEKVKAGFNALWDQFARGERWATELILAYTIGRPLQRSVSARGDLVDLLKSWRAGEVLALPGGNGAEVALDVDEEAEVDISSE